MSQRGEHNDAREPIEASPGEAKQGRRGRTVLYVLVASLAGASVALGLVFAYFA